MPTHQATAQFAGMGMITKTKKPAGVRRAVAKVASPKRRLVFRKDLPPITQESPLYGKDDTIGVVSFGYPSDKESRRRVMRARIYADNHS
ncbi:MAG TPA: hypothetical protein VIO38_11120 [Rariglobus sp.]